MKYLQRLITAFPSLLCDPPFVIATLEVLTLMQRACEGEFTDEVCIFSPHIVSRPTLICFSLRLVTSTALRGLISSLNFLIHMPLETRYCRNFTSTPTNG